MQKVIRMARSAGMTINQKKEVAVAAIMAFALANPALALDVSGVVDEIEAGGVSAGLIITALLLFGVAIFVGFFLAGKVRRG